MSVPTATLFGTGALSNRARLAAAAYLSRYTPSTQKDYAQSLDIFFRFLLQYGIDPLEAKRPHIELYMRQHLEIERGNIAVSVNHHMTPVVGFYRFAVIDEVINRNPCDGIRRPKEYHDPYRDDWLTAQELRAMIAAAKRSPRPSDQGLIALLALLGLRISEVLAVQIEDYQEVLTGHRVLRLVGKGAKPATLVVTTSCLRMLDIARGSRDIGTLICQDVKRGTGEIGSPHNYRSVRHALDRLARDCGIERRITPHMFRRGWITAGLDSGISLRDMQLAARHSDPRTTSSYDRGALNLDRSAIHILSASLSGAA